MQNERSQNEHRYSNDFQEQQRKQSREYNPGLFSKSYKQTVSY